MTERKVRLGKQEYVFDERTLKLARVISPTVVFPHHFDFDKTRSAFPLAMWGNDQWGNCVKVAQANEIIRLERLEQRRTLKITASDVVREYKVETGAQSPGDPRDAGLVMLQNNRLWRSRGFHFNGHSFKVAAFGELDPHDHDQLRAAIFLLHGVQFGLALPRAAQNMSTWDVPANFSGPEWAPGSWGGHAVFSKRYDETGIEILTWGEKVWMTWAFIDRYCDEAWAVVDDFDHWTKRPEINVEAIKKHLVEIGATNVEQ
jgi:hypothetical protein